jgi:hypothetical protein
MACGTCYDAFSPNLTITKPGDYRGCMVGSGTGRPIAWHAAAAVRVRSATDSCSRAGPDEQVEAFTFRIYYPQARPRP